MVENDELAQRLHEKGVKLTAAVTVQRPAADLYAAWHGFRDLPRFVDQLESVVELAPGRTRWNVRGPGGTYTWEAETIRDEQPAVIAWRTLADSEVLHAGAVNFHELPYLRGTEVKVSLVYIPSGGKVGEAVAKLFKDNPKNILQAALHRFRQAMETGEIATTKGQPVGADRNDAAASVDTDMRDVAQIKETQ